MKNKQICMNCGATIEENSEFGFMAIYDYDFESEDAKKIIVGYQCVDATGCAQRNIERGYNARELVAITLDKENFSREMRENAKNMLNLLSKIYSDQAKTHHLTYQEMGYGAIGH